MTFGPEHNIHPLDDSGFITLTEVTKRLPRFNGKRVHPSTAFRWTRGLRGVYLEYWRVGRKIVTTEAALHKFFSDLAKADSAPQDNQNTPRRRKHRPRPAQRRAALQEAEAILRKAKILQEVPQL